MEQIMSMKDVIVRSVIKMGFDLYGLNPYLKKGETLVQEPSDWKDKKAVDEYFEK